MKYYLLILAMLAAVAGPAAAQNLLINPGFEDTTWDTGWTTCPSAGHLCAYHAPNNHSGSDALCAEGCCGSWGDHTGGWQDVGSLDPGTTYNIGGWAKGCDNDSPGATLATIGYGGDCGAAPTTVIGSNGDCTYTQYATTVSGVSTVRFYFYAEPHPAWTASSVHWDDAFLFSPGGVTTSIEEWVLYD